MNDFKTFTLEQANRVLPEIISITEEAIRELEQIREPYESFDTKKSNPALGMTEEDLVKMKWSERIVQLGAYPKGHFAVDFRTNAPDTYYCWTYGETEVKHEHRIWETFVDRRSIESDQPEM